MAYYHRSADTRLLQSFVQGVRRRADVLMPGLALSAYPSLFTFVARRRARILEMADLEAKLALVPVHALGNNVGLSEINIGQCIVDGRGGNATNHISVPRVDDTRFEYLRTKPNSAIRWTGGKCHSTISVCSGNNRRFFRSRAG